MATISHLYHALNVAVALEKEAALQGGHLEDHNLSGIEEQDDEEVGEDELQRLEKELTELQEQFDKAVFQKHTLKKNCEQLSGKLKLARHLLERCGIRLAALICTMHQPVLQRLCC